MKKLKKYTIKKLDTNPLFHRYMSDSLFKNLVSLLGSFSFNLVYALGEIICGIYYRSFWFITLGCYYILLMLIRFVLLRGMRNKKKISRGKMYRRCGVMLLFMNMILTGIVVLAVTDNQGAHYAGYLIYAIAAYTFGRIVVQVRKLIKQRNSKNPALTISGVLGFVSSLISMLSLEIAMILQFGNDTNFFRIMTISTGTGVCIIISALAIYMIATRGGKVDI